MQLPLHCHQHLRNHRRESLLTQHHQHGRSPEFEGTIIALFHLFTWNDKGRAFCGAFWSERLPDIMNLIAAIVIFAVLFGFW
jgi:hypothetical protein